MSNNDDWMDLPSRREPAPSSISPLLGTQRVQSAVDRMAKSVDKVTGWLDKASDRLSRMSVPVGGMGSGGTLNGGRANGGGSSIGGTPMLGAGASNGSAAGSNPQWMPNPYRPATFPPNMTYPYGPPSQSGGKGNGGGASWGKWAAATGAVWGAATVQAGLERSSMFVATNTSAQLMNRNVPGGDWQKIRSYVNNNNWTAESAQDGFAGAATLMNGTGLAYGSSALNTQMAQLKNYRMLDPTISSAQAAARLASPQSIGASNFLLSRGINTSGKDGMAVANQILQRAGFSGTYKYNAKQIGALWGPQGRARMLVDQISKVDPHLGGLVSDQLHATMQAQAGGMTRDAYTNAVKNNDWDALEKAGISKTDLDNRKDVAARQRNIDDNMAGGFSTGLNNATTALGLFQEALEKLTDGPLGAAIGYGHGVSASSGLLSSAAHIGGSALGMYAGGRLASSIAANGVRGTGSAILGGLRNGMRGGGIGSRLMRGAGYGAVGSVAGGLIGDAVSDGHGGARDRWGSTISGAATGAGIGMMFGPWGAAAGAIIGGGIGYFTANQQDNGPDTGGSTGETYGIFGTGGEQSGNAVMPVGNAPITAGYGRYPKSGGRHTGIDFGVPQGTPVHANRSGKVVVAGWSNTGFGNHIRIDIGDGTIEIYGHLSQIGVRVGQTVRAGDVIGKSGSTGNSSGPHLHFEVRKGGGGQNNAIDPRSYLSGADSGYTGSANSSASPTTDASGSAGNSLGNARSMTSSPWGVNEGELISGSLGSLAASVRASQGEGDSGNKDAPASGSTAASGNLRSILQRAGFRGDALGMAYAIMMAESGGNAKAHNGNVRTGDDSYGLFQINMLGDMGPERRSRYHLANNDALYDPLTNAKVAYEMSSGGRNWNAWSTYKRGDYKKYLGGQMKSYDVGSTNIDVDQVARVHKGEMIIDPVTADQMRKALSSNNPTSVLGGGGKGRTITIGNITIQTAHQFVDSAATDLAKQTLQIIANHEEVNSIMGGK